MLITCRECGRQWYCLIQWKDECKIPKEVCELCAKCSAKRNYSTERSLIMSNPKCYPDSYDSVDINPSRRTD